MGVTCDRLLAALMLLLSQLQLQLVPGFSVRKLVG